MMRPGRFWITCPAIDNDIRDIAHLNISDNVSTNVYRNIKENVRDSVWRGVYMENALNDFEAAWEKL